MDVAMPMVIARAQDFGLTGYETVQELDNNTEIVAALIPARLRD